MYIIKVFYKDGSTKEYKIEKSKFSAERKSFTKESGVISYKYHQVGNEWMEISCMV